MTSLAVKFRAVIVINVNRKLQKIQNNVVIAHYYCTVATTVLLYWTVGRTSCDVRGNFRKFITIAQLGPRAACFLLLYDRCCRKDFVPTIKLITKCDVNNKTKKPPPQAT
jgi:hypothetical protein